MRQELDAFFMAPDGESYMALRKKIVMSDSYHPYSDELETVAQLYEQEKYEDAQKLLVTSMENLLLSPRAHQLLAMTYTALGNENGAHMEKLVAQTFMEAFLMTGNGTQDKPFLVVRVSDEHDIIDHFNKQVSHQQVLQIGDRHLDHIVCTDGSEYWFDVTDAYNQLA
jgi:hypothetical protein